MGKEGGFREWLRSKRAKSPNPTQASSASTPQTATPSPSQTVSAGSASSQLQVPANSPPGQSQVVTVASTNRASVVPVQGVLRLPPSPQQTRKSALELALKNYLDRIPEAEKQAFRDASAQTTDDNLTASIQKIDDEHKKVSIVRRHGDRLIKFLGCLDRFMDVVGLGVKAAPEFCSFIVGAAKIVIRLAIDFVEFFSKLSEMLGRLGDHLGHLAEYAKAAIDNLPLVHDSVAKAYVDVLEFCREARNVFFDLNGNQRKWLSFRTFLQIQWEPFESKFSPIEANLQHHLNVLQHAALAAQLNENEEVRRERERIKLREERW